MQPTAAPGASGAPATAGALDGLWIDLSTEPPAVLVVEHERPVTQTVLETSNALPAPLSWFDDRWPHARARVMARRLGMQVVEDAEEPTLRTASGETVVVGSALGEQLGTLIETHGDGRTLWVILPHHPPGQVALNNILLLAGAVDPQLLGETEMAAAPASGSNGEHTTLHLAMGGVESRITLVVDKQAHLPEMLPDAGCTEAERLLVAGASHALACEHGINVEEDPSLLNDLQQQIARMRRSSAEAPWEVAIAGAPVTMEAEQLQRLTQVPSERIALACSDLLRRHGVEPAALSALSVAGSTAPWPGLLAVLSTHLGVQANLWTDHLWGRLAAAAKVELPHTDNDTPAPAVFSPTTS